MSWFWQLSKSKQPDSKSKPLETKNKPLEDKLLEPAEFSIITDLTITTEVLGRGSYGIVYGAEYNGKSCVAKEMHEQEFLRGDGPTPLQMCVQEINTLSSLRHPSIVQFLGAYFENKSKVPILVMERMWNNLTNLLEQRPNKLPLLIKTHILYDVACGLQYLHGQEKPVIHRDLNARNILLSESLDAKIADLGQAKVLKTITGQVLSTKPGFTAVMPPEALEHNSIYGPQLDVFSFGCNVVHLVTEQFPTPTEEFVMSGSVFVRKPEADRRREFIDLLAESSTFLQELSEKCLENEPSERPNTFEICISLEKHLKQLEAESPKLATQYKQDKLYLMQVIKTLEGELDTAKNLENVLTSQIYSLQNNLADKEDTNEKITASYNSNISELKAKNLDLKNTVDVYKQTNSTLESHKDDLTAKNRALESEKEDLIAKNNDLNSEVYHLQEQLKTLQRSCVEYQQEMQKQHQSFNEINDQLLCSKKKHAEQKQQLEEKSYRLNACLIELHESMHSQKENSKLLEDRNSMLSELLEKEDTLHIKLDRECKDKDKSLKRKESEIRQLKREHADDKSNIQAQHTREVQTLMATAQMYTSELTTYDQIKKLVKNEAQYKSGLEKNAEDKITNLQNELECSVASLNEFKRQIDCHEKNLKEKVKQAETLEKYNFSDIYSPYKFTVSWYPYLSLPVKRIRSSATIVKDKVFVAGGHGQLDTKAEDLNSYLNTMERGNEVFCFHTGKCRCDSIASPVVLGGVASVNGQCVLVSGAEWNTLTGNVYVLCEEGSDEQWKKFSEPVPTPRILPCVCCYGERWLIVCGGYACKEGSNLLEAVSVVEILDITKKEWHTVSREQCPNVFEILCCALVDKNLYVIGDDKIFKCNLNKLITTTTKHSENDVPLWSETETQIEGIHPFSVVDVNGELMIIASISGSEDDVTCVLMKDTTDTWRKMSEAVECQHCSAVVVTPTLELLLFGGSESIAKEKATYTCQCGSCYPALNMPRGIPLDTNREQLPSEQLKLVQNDIPNHPPAVSFTGPIHTQQFDHNGGTFQSPVHKVSIVVPPNAIDDGEKVTVHMGATTSGPFDLPEDCKLRSAVVWLGSSSDVVLKRSIAVVVPHSAVLTSPQHHSMMRFLTCENCEGPRYKFDSAQGQFEIYKEEGSIELNKMAMIVIVARSKNICNSAAESDEEFHDTLEEISPKNTTPSIRYLAKLFWPGGQVPNSFAAQVYCSQDLPTVSHKVNTQYRQAFYKENEVYPDIMDTKFMIDGDGTELKCVLPCSGSSECDCLSGWEVNYVNEIQGEKGDRKPSGVDWMVDPTVSSFNFSSKFPTSGRFEFVFQGAKNLLNIDMNEVQLCAQKRHDSDDPVPFIIKEVQQEMSAKDEMNT